MNPFGNGIYILGAIIIIAMAMIGCGVYFDIPALGIVGAFVALVIVIIVIGTLSGTRFT